MQQEFKDLKQADIDYEGTTESEREIKVLVDKIDRKLAQYETEKENHTKYLRTKLDQLTDKQIRSLDNATIIKDIRQFKEKLEDTLTRIEEVEDLLRDLNDKLVAQDLMNAVRVFTQQQQSLKKRLGEAHEKLKRINQSSEEMDGNSTTNDEDDFTNALKSEMPQVFKNIDEHFELL